jgi:DNA-binding beta-propeller fold protein YncE
VPSGASGGASSTATGGAAGVSTGGVSSSGGSPGTGGAAALSPRLFYLDIGGGRVLSAKPDGSDVRVLVRGASSLPDGVAVDVAGGHLFWTNMGLPNANDGFVNRTDLDGMGLSAPVATGKTFTPKQLKLDAVSGKLYWADREGMRIQRANLDGTMLETLFESATGDTARADAANWCVGIALDVPGKKIYWTQKGGDNAGVGSLRRAGIEVPAGEDPAHRTDVEILFDHLPEPIDLDVDLSSRLVYWTDRGNPPKGNTVSRAPMDPPSTGAAGRTDQQILVSNLAEGIGISLDTAHDVMYFTDLGGTVYSAKLDGTMEKKVLTGQGSLTGIAYVELPP